MTNVLGLIAAGDSSVLDEVRRHALASKLEELDRDRLIQVAARVREVTQSQLAAAAMVSQPRVSQIARSTIAVVDGFHGATPYEVAERHAAGLIDEATLVDELVRWPYADERPVDDVADVWSPGVGTFNDVERAFFDRLISADLYDTIVEKLGDVQS